MLLQTKRQKIKNKLYTNLPTFIKLGMIAMLLKLLQPSTYDLITNFLVSGHGGCILQFLNFSPMQA
jgi:uncharacterized membrane protein YjjP (DUF1212 family)